MREQEERTTVVNIHFHTTVNARTVMHPMACIWNEHPDFDPAWETR